MNAEIICIGTELLLGQIVDTNAAFLAQELAFLGLDLYHKTTVGDNLSRMTAALRQAWERADVLLLSGGLGPTQDDLTREAIGELLGEELELRPDAWAQIEAYFQKTNRPMVESNRRQAMFPQSARAITNPRGTAPGIAVALEGGAAPHYLFAMPGVPSELRGMWHDTVKPFLADVLRRRGETRISSRMIRMTGIGESAMEETIIDLIRQQSNPTIAPYAGRGEVYLRVTAKSGSATENRHLLDNTVTRIQERLSPYIYGYDEDNLETVVGVLLKRRNWRLATAESCTSGFIAHRITNVPGSSDYFMGGVNCYSNQLKNRWAGVPEETIRTYGAVSPETAAAMAEGIVKQTGAEVGLAVTGIAGPGGGSAVKPVGLVYLAIAVPGGTDIIRRNFGLDRIGNKEAAAQAALTLLWQKLALGSNG